MPPSQLIAGSSKHAQIARALLRDIQAGKYPIGTQLPSETDLTIELGVSRQTIRTALRHLRELRLIQGLQGVGSFVVATQPFARYVHAFESIEDLLQYATNTVLKVLSRREIGLDAQQAQWLGRKEGERWWQIHTVRHTPDGDAMASSTLMLPYIYGHIIQDMESSGQPAFALIEKNQGESITEILQDISVAILEESDARTLGLALGDAALCIERRYFGHGGELLEVSRTLHPAHAFHYSMRVRTHMSQPLS
ncbi:GntR family transcriptional regulator [Alcaligenaceae bacterium]|nr:GntR family transcriptional regulator [Alcaligenaceae bacterium]